MRFGLRASPPMLAVLAAAVLFPAAAARPETPSKCAAAEFRQLDFWAGDWDAYDVGESKPAARAYVDSILGGCVLREIYEQSDGLVGQSFSIYDASRKLWHQSWVTNRGSLLQIDGRFQNGILTMQGPQVGTDGREQIVRSVWKREGDAVRETAHMSPDGGKTWRPLFDMVFRRHAGKEAAMTIAAETDGEGASTEVTIRQLNQGYVDAFLKADVGWYREHLVEDFVCIEPDGSRIGREEFLQETARDTDVVTYTLKDVQVRTFGSVALVHARGDFVRRDGSTGTSLYTDAWARLGGKWKAVSAQITRRPAAPK